MKNPPASSPALKPRHWLLAKSRQWHTWGGLIAAIFLVIVGSSGIVLNYKKPIFGALGLETGPQKPGKEMPPQKTGGPSAPVTLTTGGGVSGGGMSLDGALALARAEWGDVRLERIELKEERGELIYKLKEKGGGELWVNAADGSHFVKGEYERIGKAGADGVPVRTTDWGKILIDLHTGKIAGGVGIAIMSGAAGLLLLLSLSGVYMWLKPLLIRRQNARAKALAAARPVAPLDQPRPELVQA